MGWVQRLHRNNTWVSRTLDREHVRWLIEKPGRRIVVVPGYSHVLDNDVSLSSSAQHMDRTIMCRIENSLRTTNTPEVATLARSDPLRTASNMARLFLAHLGPNSHKGMRSAGAVPAFAAALVAGDA